MVTQLQPDVRAYLHGGEVIKRYIRVEEVAHEYGFSVEETEYIAKAASSLYKLTRIHLVKKERFDEFMKHIYKVPGTNKQIIKKFARIGEASIIYSIGRHRFIELARAAGATYKINEGTGGTVLVNLEIFDNYMEQFRQPVRPLKEPLYGQEEGELIETPRQDFSLVATLGFGFSRMVGGCSAGGWTGCGVGDADLPLPAVTG